MSKTVQTERWRRRIGISELEVRLHANRSTITRWVKAGRLPPPHYLGARRLWFEDEIVEFEIRTMAAAGLES